MLKFYQKKAFLAALALGIVLAFGAAPAHAQFRSSSFTYDAPGFYFTRGQVKVNGYYSSGYYIQTRGFSHGYSSGRGNGYKSRSFSYAEPGFAYSTGYAAGPNYYSRDVYYRGR